MNRVFLLFSCLLFLSRSYAFCNAFYILNNNVQIKPIYLKLNGDEIEKDVKLDITTGGQYTLVRVYQDYNILPGMSMEGIVRYWIQYNPQWIYENNVPYRIYSDLHTPDSNIVPYYKTVITPEQKSHWEWESQYCGQQNDKFNFPMKIINGIYVMFKVSDIIPGEYSFNIPIKIGYEENKGLWKIDEGWKFYPNDLYRSKEINIPVNVNVESKCTFPMKTGIDINFGDIKDKDLLMGKQKSITFPIYCTSPASVDLKILGNNTTPCGNGMCSLTLDDGKTNVLKLVHGNNNVKINATINSQTVFTGDFNSSFILNVSIL